MIRINIELLSYIEQLRVQGKSELIREEVALAGNKIVKEKTQVFSVFIVKNGLAKCYLKEDTGEDFIQEFFGEGEVFGEVECFTNRFSFCTIEALTAVTYYRIAKKDFMKLIQSDITFNNLILSLMATKIRYTALRHSYNQTHDVEQNLARLRESVPDLLEKISKKDIANYLGITVRSLNRTLKSEKST